MASSLDEKIDRERVNQFASQMAHVSKNVKALLEETFSGEHSIDFYEGLLSAYANMFLMVSNLPQEKLREYSGPIVAFVAEQLQKMYTERGRRIQEN